MAEEVSSERIETRPGYEVGYPSRRDLVDDHGMYLKHGGLMVPWTESPPETNTEVVVRVTAVEDEQSFEMVGRVISHMPGSGFMVTFDDSSRDERGALTEFVESDEFKTATDDELSMPNSREVKSFDAAIQKKVKRLKRKRRYVSLKFADDEEKTNPIAENPLLEDDDVPTDELNLEDALDGVGDLSLESALGESTTKDARSKRSAPDADVEDVLGDAPKKRPKPRRKSNAKKEKTKTKSKTKKAKKEGPDKDKVKLQSQNTKPSEKKMGEGVHKLHMAEVTADSDEPFKHPPPGGRYIVFVVKFLTITDFMEVMEAFRVERRLAFSVDESEVKPSQKSRPGALSHLRIQLPGRNIFQMYAVIARVDDDDIVVRVNKDVPEHEQVCAFPHTFKGKKWLGRETEDQRGPLEVLRFVEERDVEVDESMPIRARIKRMSMEEKINLALSGNKEARRALATDTNKAIPHYLLKNARIGLDEIAFMARMPSMNPDVLLKIGENTSYTQSPQIVRNLVYNPKTPFTLAKRLLDRLPRSELMLLAKRKSMNQRLVQAAKKKLGVR